MRLSIGVGKCGERFDEIGLRPRLPSRLFTGLCMGSFALSVLCKVLMDMKYFELDFISETKHWGGEMW